MYHINSGDKYIINSISEYSEKLNDILYQVFLLLNSYSKKHIEYSRCAQNTKYIFTSLQKYEDIFKVGRIIIRDTNINISPEIIESIRTFYGPEGTSINGSFHEIPFLEINIEDKIYFVAIKVSNYTTTSSFMQNKVEFYVGTDFEDFVKLIQTRYQCPEIIITNDFETHWSYITKGGKITKKHKYTK